VINSPLLRKFIRRPIRRERVNPTSYFGDTLLKPPGPAKPACAARRRPWGNEAQPEGRTLEIGASGLKSGEGQLSDR
jgi:hypothetical protein